MAQQRLLKLDKDGKPFTGNDVGPNGELRYYKNGRLLEGIGGAAQMLQGGFEDFVEPLVDGGKNYWNRQTRLTNEAFRRNETKPNINEYFNSILQERWDSAVTEDDKASVRDLLAAFNVKEEKDIIQSETGAAPTSVIPESFSEYRRRTRTEDETTAGGKVQETIQSGQPLEENQYQTWNTDMDEDKGVVGTVGDKEWTKDFEDPETAAKREWLENSANTPAAKAFAEGTDQQKKDWGNLRWEARKRHKKLFDYNTDKEK